MRMSRFALALSVLLMLVVLAPAQGAERTTIVTKEIHFALDRADLTAASRAILQEVAQILRDNPAAAATLTGHTCDLASNPYNVRLAQRRADAATAYLVRQAGITRERILESSYGEEQPKYDNNDPASKPLNRRVEIAISIATPIPPPTVTLTADPASILRGSASRLSWTSTNATSVEVTPGLGAVALAGGSAIQPSATTTYRARARGEGGEAQAEATVTVNEPPAPAENLKVVTTSVIDQNGDFLRDLGAANFAVKENGVAREIVRVTYEASSVAASVGLVLDKSASLGSDIRRLKQAAISFVENKKPTDRILVMGFSSDVVCLRNFDTDKEGIMASIRRLQSAGFTRLYDALYESAERMDAAAQPRILVLMTDGVDEGGPFGEPGSRRTLDEAIAKAKETGVTVYTIGLGRKLDRGILERISRETNGFAYFTTDAGQLEEIYRKISQGVLQGQYRIEYRSPVPEGVRADVFTNAGRIVGN